MHKTPIFGDACLDFVDIDFLSEKFVDGELDIKAGFRSTFGIILNFMDSRKDRQNLDLVLRKIARMTTTRAGFWRHDVAATDSV